MGFSEAQHQVLFFHLILFLLSLFFSLNLHAWLRNCRLSNRLLKKKKKRRRTATVLAYQTAEAPPSNLNGPRWSPFESQYAFVAVNHLRFINIMLLSIDFFSPPPTQDYFISLRGHCAMHRGRPVRARRLLSAHERATSTQNPISKPFF